jgi:BAH domain
LTSLIRPRSKLLYIQRVANILTSSQSTYPSDAQITMASAPGPRRAQQYQRLVDGSISETPGGTLSYDVLPKGRGAAESVIFKVCFAPLKFRRKLSHLKQGIEYKVGDFVHLSNPDDMSRPLIGQIWACWGPADRQSFTVCWYFRPEQTSHRPNHPFYENEVIKTGWFSVSFMQYPKFLTSI